MRTLRHMRTMQPRNALTHAHHRPLPARANSPCSPASSAARMAAGLALPVARMTRTPALHAARMAPTAAGWLQH